MACEGDQAVETLTVQDPSPMSGLHIVVSYGLCFTYTFYGAGHTDHTLLENISFLEF